jgi:hypothetical protein
VRGEVAEVDEDVAAAVVAASVAVVREGGAGDGRWAEIDFLEMRARYRLPRAESVETFAARPMPELGRLMDCGGGGDECRRGLGISCMPPTPSPSQPLLAFAPCAFCNDPPSSAAFFSFCTAARL